jgi:DNA-binding IclR family transcriptional regulator
VDNCTLLAQHGLPVVVVQALDDLQLPPAARLMMWHLRLRLDLVAFREVKAASLAREMRIKDQTAARLLLMLADRGYLRMQERTFSGPKAYALPWSRIRDTERAA